jgi:hypothetical protein
MESERDETAATIEAELQWGRRRTSTERERESDVQGVQPQFENFSAFWARGGRNFAELSVEEARKS